MVSGGCNSSQGCRAHGNGSCGAVGCWGVTALGRKRSSRGLLVLFTTSTLCVALSQAAHVALAAAAPRLVWAGRVAHSMRVAVSGWGAVPAASGMRSCKRDVPIHNLLHCEHTHTLTHPLAGDQCRPGQAYWLAALDRDECSTVLTWWLGVTLALCRWVRSCFGRPRPCSSWIDMDCPCDMSSGRFVCTGSTAVALQQ